MWLLPLSFFTILAIAFLLAKPKNTTTTTNNNNKNYKYPPSPPIIPLIGNLIWLVRPLTQIGTTLRRLRCLGPVVSLNFGPFPAILILDRDLIHQALVQQGAIFSDRPPFPSTGSTAIFSSNGHNISSARGSVWRLLRRNLTAEILHPSRVKSYSGFRRRVLGHLLRDLREKAGKEGSEVIVAEKFRHAMFRLLALMCFGESITDEVVGEIEKVQRELLLIGLRLSVFDLMPVMGKVVFWRRWRKFLAIRRRQEEILIPFIRARREVVNSGSLGGDDGPVAYIDSLLNIELPEEGGRKLTDDEVVSLCSEFFNGGLDTTVAAMEWAMANLVQDHQLQQRLLDEINSVVKEEDVVVTEDSLQDIPFIKAVILEALRRHPPVQLLLPHATTEGTTLGSYMIPKGSTVNFALVAMGLDETVWEEPMEFRPERFATGGGVGMVDLTGSKEIKMMPFGAGRRICPGLNLAMLHLEFFLANVVREFEWKKMVEGEDVDMSEKLEFSVVLKNPLRARIACRRKTQ